MKPTCFRDGREGGSPNQVKGQDASFHSWGGRARTRGTAQIKSQLSAGQSPRRTSDGKAGCTLVCFYGDQLTPNTRNRKVLRSVVRGVRRRRKNGATRTDDARCFGRNLSHDGDPERHDFPVAGVKGERESLGEHHLWCDLYIDYSYHDVGLGVLHILGSH